MLFERITSKGLAHYSYLVGDRTEAIAIDPRRDCEIYIQKASAEGMRIKYILETHRNEDYFVGSMELAQKTGAELWHADGQLDYKYGQVVKDGHKWEFGRLEIEAIHTPGHTLGSMSYILRDPNGFRWIIFTGDTLFAGDVGRIDLMGKEMSSELAEHLYDSIFGRLLVLGDEVIICPAHGAGSVCGESIAERLWTTIGLEGMYNPKLQFKSKEEFKGNLLRSLQERPPYFRKMEIVNLEGRPILGSLPTPKPLAPKEFEAMAHKAQIIDTRMEIGFGAAHVPGAQSIWMDGLASFAGWYLSYEKPILLVNETNNPEEIVSTLIRLGFDDIVGYLAGGMLAWHMAGKESDSIRTMTVQNLCTLLDRAEPSWILDVRSDEELHRDGTIIGANHIHVTHIPERYQEVPKDRTVHVFCGSGMRSMIAASYLQRHGWRDLIVILGGMAGWKSISCPIKNDNR
ncbi:MAG: MBL fold metallo-hydrolase [Methanotrichaceae archaeon]|nr:MBL fold metallo-hydrolase [Methanotrichaceae archaeon]